jgi:hypothetical protein
MARIVIKDLKESVELDREAMRQITGGRSGLRLTHAATDRSSLFRQPTSFSLLQLGGFEVEPDWQ